MKGCNVSFPPPKERLRRLLQTQYSVGQKHRAVIDSMAGQPDYADLVFVTAASANHFVESQELVRDLHQLVFPQLRKENNFSFHFFYYDLGLEQHQLTQVGLYVRGKKTHTHTFKKKTAPENSDRHYVYFK